MTTGTRRADALSRERIAAAIRAVTVGIHDVIDAHPWVGTQLAREPGQSAMLPVLERIGAQLQAMRVPEAAQFDVASALLNVLLGLAAQHAAAARLPAHDDRAQFLAGVDLILAGVEASTAEGWVPRV